MSAAYSGRMSKLINNNSGGVLYGEIIILSGRAVRREANERAEAGGGKRRRALFEANATAVAAIALAYIPSGRYLRNNNGILAYAIG